MMCNESETLSGCGECRLSVSDSNLMKRLNMDVFIKLTIDIARLSKRRFIHLSATSVVCNGALEIADTDLYPRSAVWKENAWMISIVILAYCKMAQRDLDRFSEYELYQLALLMGDFSSLRQEDGKMESALEGTYNRLRNPTF